MASTSNSESASTTVEENRIRVCEEFATIAETDVAVAQRYLANNEWQMEVMFIYMLNIGSFKKKQSALETLQQLAICMAVRYTASLSVYHVLQCADLT